MTVLVTNANGKVGQEVVRALLAKGVPVRVGARTPDKARAQFPGAEVVPFDFGNREAVRSALTGVSAVFSAVPYELLPLAETDLIAQAKAAGVKRFVKLSALGVEVDPRSPHMIAETALGMSGLAWTVIRPTFFMQNYAVMSAGTIREQGRFYEAAADGRSAFVDTRDIADVVVAALTTPGHEGKVYALTGPDSLGRAEVASKIAAAAGRPVEYVPVDDAALRSAMAGAPQSLTELMSLLFGAVRAGHTDAVHDGVPTVLGRPARSFDAFARDHAAVWRA
jgi:uncharacterized protein YbjT (DUF2867 family)